MVLQTETNLLVSVATIFATLCLSEVIRRFLIKVVPTENGDLLRICLEFVASFEMLAVAYERGICKLVYMIYRLKHSHTVAQMEALLF